MQALMIKHNSKTPEQVEITVEFMAFAPYQAIYEGLIYWATGKKGRNLGTGRPMVELATDDDARMWISTDGQFATLD